MIQFDQQSGFVAGTLVHTDKGLVPIEQIKVGDLVPSRHEIGEWELAYKRVTKTLITENQPIWAMELSGKIKDSDGFKEEFLFTTANHPLWTFEKYIVMQSILLVENGCLYQIWRWEVLY